MPDLKVVELFCGIGGFHSAFEKAKNELKGAPTEIEYKVLSAMDINNNATSCYKLNHMSMEKDVINTDINAAPWEQTSGYNTLAMSPPCQPFTRNGKQKDKEDARTKPLLSIIEKIKTAKKKFLPRYIIMENVKFFEKSETCKDLLAALDSRNFIYRQFLISPTDLGTPNQRARYFLIAKRGKHMKFHFDPYVINWKKKNEAKEPENKKQRLNDEEEKDLSDNEEEIADHLKEETGARKMPTAKVKMYENMDVFVRHDGPDANSQILGLKKKEKIHSLERYIQDLDFKEEVWNEIYVLTDQLKRRFLNVLDIVRTSSSRSICFTKAYGKYAQGTGSMIDMMEKIDPNDRTKDREPEDFELRYFTEMEVAGLMGFPKDFSFPPDLTTRQRYALLGNSLNVDVAAVLIKLMVLGDDETKLSPEELSELNRLKAEFQ